MVNVVLLLAVYFGMSGMIGGILLYYLHGRRKGSRPILEELKDLPGTLVHSLDGGEGSTRKRPSLAELTELQAGALHSVTLEPSQLEGKGLGDAELDRLRLQVWRSRRRRTKLMGRIYLAAGFASLVAGYFSGYFGLELIAAVMVPLGVFFTFSSNESYVKTSIAGQSVISTMRVLQEALKANSDEGHAIFVPGNAEQREVMMFIPKKDDFDESLPFTLTLGHFYTPMGHELFKAYLRERGGKIEAKLSPLLDQLKIIMTSALELVDDMDFEVFQSAIRIRLKNATFAEIGRFPELAKDVYARAGCPVTNSIAEWISFGTNSKVKWVDAQIDPIARTAYIRLTLIPAD